MNIRLFPEHRLRLVLLSEKAQTRVRKEKAEVGGWLGGGVGNCSQRCTKEFFWYDARLQRSIGSGLSLCTFTYILG